MRCGRTLPSESQPPPHQGRGACLVAAIASVLFLVTLIAVAAFLLWDPLSTAWRGLFGRPTPAVATLTPFPTTLPPVATGTATPSPSPALTPTLVPSATPSVPSMETATPQARRFKLVYGDCIPHGSGLGSVKGQVFDRNGQVLPGSKVRIKINDYEWVSDANPATTNQDGWYEWTLEVGQKVEFVELIVGGLSVPFSPMEFEVTARSGCFQRVDFVEE